MNEVFNIKMILSLFNHKNYEVYSIISNYHSVSLSLTMFIEVNLCIQNKFANGH
jgi:hypothetical protein